MNRRIEKNTNSESLILHVEHQAFLSSSHSNQLDCDDEKKCMSIALNHIFLTLFVSALFYRFNFPYVFHSIERKFMHLFLKHLIFISLLFVLFLPQCFQLVENEM